jgi:hypothetical protein
MFHICEARIAQHGPGEHARLSAEIQLGVAAIHEAERECEVAPRVYKGFVVVDALHSAGLETG